MKSRNLKTAFLCIGMILAVSACSGGGGGGAKVPKPPAEKTYPTGKAPMSLPEVTDGTAVSKDRQTMNGLMARAARENKAVVLEVAAAWCGPCMQFAYDMETHPEYAQKLLSDGYILAKTETEKKSQLSMNDFVPSFIKFFPSFYLYTPGQGWKMLGSANDYKTLDQSLRQAKETGAIGATEFKTVIEAWAAAPDSPAGQAASNRVFNSVYTMSAYYSYDESKAILKTLRNESKRFPTLRLSELADEGQMVSMTDYVAAGVLTVDELSTDFPEIAADLTDMSRQSFSISHFLAYRMEYLAREIGPKAAAAQCEVTAAGIRGRLKPGTLSAEEAKVKLVTIEKGTTTLCAAMELRANGVTDDLKRKAEGLDRTTMTDWELLAALGDTPAAQAAYQKRYKMFADHYVTALASANESLKKAIEAGENDKVEELKKRIAVLEYQTKNHAEVEADVKDALNTGRVLEIIKVLN